MRTAIYARVSTNRQTADNQLEQLRAFAAGRGHQVTTEYIDTESGANEERAQLQAMLQDAARRRFDLLIFWSLDRLSRSGVPQTLQLLQRLQDAGVKFVSLQQPEIDTSSPWGFVVVAVFAAVAQIERDLLRERTRAGLRRARAQGKQIGRPRRVLDLERLKEMHQAGMSPAQIARAVGASKATVARRLSASSSPRPAA